VSLVACVTFGAFACSGEYLEEPRPPVPAPSASASAAPPITDAAVAPPPALDPDAADATTDCTPLSLDANSGGVMPHIGGRTTLTNGVLALVPGGNSDAMGWASFTFERASRIEVTFTLAPRLGLTRCEESFSFALYPEMVAGGSVAALYGLPKGPGVGAFYRLAPLPFQTQVQMTTYGGDFLQTSPTRTLVTLGQVATRKEIVFRFDRGTVTLTDVATFPPSIYTSAVGFAFGAKTSATSLDACELKVEGLRARACR